jgi:hypothetical protein
MDAALLAAYANCPLLEPFIRPEMDATLITLELYPGVRPVPLASKGRKAIAM